MPAEERGVSPSLARLWAEEKQMLALETMKSPWRCEQKQRNEEQGRREGGRKWRMWLRHRS